MGDWLEWKYLGFLSSRLHNFKIKSNEVINFSCPFCRERETSSKKNPVRGYIFDAGDRYRYYCQRCTASMKASNFIKTIDPELYQEFLKERYIEDNKRGRNSVVESQPSKLSVAGSIPVARSTNPLSSIQKISRLPPNHPARLYLEERKFPPEIFRRLYFTNNFMKWVNTFITDKYGNVDMDDPRVVIPFFDTDGELYAVTGRSINPNSKKRYINMKVTNKEIPAIFGMDTCDFDKMVYVTEGPLDALFLENAVAAAGGDITSKLSQAGFKKMKTTIVFDNEPRAIHTVDKIKKAIREGYWVTLWPSEVREKDVNEMILAGRTPQEVQKLVQDNSFHGLRAELELGQWRKV